MYAVRCSIYVLVVAANLNLLFKAHTIAMASPARLMMQGVLDLGENDREKLGVLMTTVLTVLMVSGYCVRLLLDSPPAQ